MSALNIRRDVKDAFYRYKMPGIIVKVEGKGNGIKTVIVNMTEIGRSLNRPPSYPTKFFGCELGAQVICDDKTGRYIVNGCHEAHRLQEMMDIFINKFILCSSCKNPETDLVVSKDGIVYTKCKACGEKNSIDQTHKLIPFILKTITPKSKKKSCKDDSPVEEEEGAKKNHSELIAVVVDHMPIDPGLDDLTNGFQHHLVVDEEEEDSEEDNPLDLFAKFLHESPSNKEVLNKIEALKIKPYKALTVYMQVIFTENILEELPGKISLLKELCTNDKSQKGLLGGLERLVSIIHESLQKKLPYILQLLYEGDILEEDILLEWASHPSKKYVGARDIAKRIRVSAEPFIHWLKNAEEANEESDE